MELDAQTQALLDGMHSSGLPPLYELSPADARMAPAAVAEMIGAGPEVGGVEDITIPVRDAELGARVYSPVGEPVATIVYYHGGGWVIGNVDQWDAICRALTVASGARLVSVEYRLAPEHPFPTAHDDCYDATVWVAENLAQGSPLVVAGDSAGGNLAASTALRARDSGPEIALQLLVYPITDHDLTRDSYARYTDAGLILNTEEMVWFWDHYVPDVADRDDPLVSPLRAADLSGLPPAHVILAEHDPLLDEGRAYAERLEAAGVPVTVSFYPKQIHAFFSLLNILDTAAEGAEDAGRAIREAVASRS